MDYAKSIKNSFVKSIRLGCEVLCYAALRFCSPVALSKSVVLLGASLSKIHWLLFTFGIAIEGRWNYPPQYQKQN